MIDLVAVTDAETAVEITDGPSAIAEHRRSSGKETVVCADVEAALAAVEPGTADLVVVGTAGDAAAIGPLLNSGGVVIVAPPGSWSRRISARYDHALEENRTLRDRVIAANDLAEKARWELETIRRSRSYRVFEPARRLAARLRGRGSASGASEADRI